MKKKNSRLTAIDSGVILATLNLPNDKTAKEDIEAAMRILSGEVKQHELFFSVLVVTECLCAANTRATGPTAPEAVAKLKAFFEQFIAADLDRLIAVKAAQIGCENRLRGADAAILATAIHHQADYFVTLDKKLLRADGRVPIKIIRPSDFPLPQTIPGLEKIN